MALQFLMTREITDMRPFQLALESMGKPPLSVGRTAPTPGLVDQFFNDSTGEGDLGAVDVRGPSNEGEPWKIVEADIAARRGTKREPSVGSACSTAYVAARMPASASVDVAGNRGTRGGVRGTDRRCHFRAELG